MRRAAAAAILLAALGLAGGRCAAQGDPIQTLPVTPTKPQQSNPPTPTTPQTKPIQTSTTTSDARLLDAQKAADKGDYARVAQLLADFLKDHPENAPAHFQLAYAYGELKRSVESAAEYRRATEIDPSFATAHLNLGLTLLERGDNAGAAPAFLRAAELMPGQAKPHFLAGLALERSGKLQEAIQQYEQAGAADSKNFDIYFRWGLTLARVGHAAEAEERLHKAIELKPDSAPAHLALASALIDEKKPEAATVELTEYLKLSPNDLNARLQLASALNDLGKPSEALAELDRADAMGSPGMDRLKLRASIQISQKDWDGAAKTLAAAESKAPQDPELHAELGRILLEKRDFPAAERELRRALALNPNEPGALGNLISTVYLARNYLATLDLLDVQEKRMSPTPIMLFVRATCYDKLQKKAQAAAAYQKFLDADQGRSDKEEFQARERLKLLQRELAK
ncbi:MAG TPA: tetratricopeptide repeat protein [Candidatus Acidoferrales bacterium]|jgi:tetratricopeptide (TPR) repeat protein|nr:tetratricopeptide repeat protein [Candidatus Acidoferrales bacterium]